MTIPDIDSMTDEQWHAILHGDHPALRRGRRFFGLLPANPRCKVCNAPFSGVGGVAMKLIGRGPFEKNPNFCRICLTTSEQRGVEIEISMLFADVRGSTSLAEEMSPSRFTRLMNRFFDTAMGTLIRTDAWIDRLVGDEVVALYIPGFAGPQHARRAVEAAQLLLRATGHADRGGPWIPIGVGVHTGLAYVGMVGSKGGVSDLTAMGDSMNITARLTSLAAPGEALVSQAACIAAELDVGGFEQRRLDLKGRTEPVDVRVLRVTPNQDQGGTPEIG
jgi:adenylate cyclase